MIHIGRNDIIWNYAATILRIASSAILLPLILKLMPSEMVGIWVVFITITSFASLLDFGFNPAFTRNVSYIFSGVRSLKITGFELVDNETQTVDYGLLKGVIAAMRWLYLRMAIILLLLLGTLGTYYVYNLLKKYAGNHYEVYIAWGLLCFINTYNLYTLYYDSLLEGKGLIKRSKQIVIIGQTVYLIMAAILIVCGFGLVAIVSAQASSVVIIRWLSYHSFFTRELKDKLHFCESRSQKQIIKTIYPNALKIGLTSLGGFMVQRSAIIIGSLFLSLQQIASYGITVQLIAVIAGLSGIYSATYLPKIAQLRVIQNVFAIKTIYIKGQNILFCTYLIGGTVLLLLGSSALNFIGSHTPLMSFHLTILAIFLSLEETNLAVAGNILLTKNEVPFFKASLSSGLLIIVGLLFAFYYFRLGLMTLILVPLTIDLMYQAWKWPWEVIKELNIGFKLFSFDSFKKLKTNE